MANTYQQISLQKGESFCDSYTALNNKQYQLRDFIRVNRSTTPGAAQGLNA